MNLLRWMLLPVLAAAPTVVRLALGFGLPPLHGFPDGAIVIVTPLIALVGAHVGGRLGKANPKVVVLGKINPKGVVANLFFGIGIVASATVAIEVFDIASALTSVLTGFLIAAGSMAVYPLIGNWSGILAANAAAHRAKLARMRLGQPEGDEARELVGGRR